MRSSSRNDDFASPECVFLREKGCSFKKLNKKLFRSTRQPSEKYRKSIIFYNSKSINGPMALGTAWAILKYPIRLLICLQESYQLPSSLLLSLANCPPLQDAQTKINSPCSRFNKLKSINRMANPIQSKTLRPYRSMPHRLANGKTKQIAPRHLQWRRILL